MTFQLNHDDTFEANVPDGEYEVVIKTVGENVTQNGAEYCQFDLVIRNDIEQPNKNNHIFHKVWRTKATGEYNPKSFNSIGKAANLPNGKSYTNLQELFDDFIGRAVRVRVKNETSQHNGNTYENLNVKQWIPTRIQGAVRHVHKEQAARQAANDAFSMPPEQFTISDDDLPF
jgi:Protein of unknown function (DUF669)